ncbi:hypothetical protein ES288_A10G283400v1 [Gossypium darwinii]|uniref:Coenzyme Q-binding protein COQ10 START domain-containing protein n=1 Tax=Gossypium darwinii TaxID=34276 RepID=A0A5D2F409_GOSDA|nr:hypothetical protein ES288_A10G283400v1 [Gossypium darwinii]
MHLSFFYETFELRRQVEHRKKLQTITYTTFLGIINPNNIDNMAVETEGKKRKWHGSVSGIVDSPLDKVWTIVSQSKRLSQWMPMVEQCIDLVGDEGVPGYVRLVSSFMFPQQDGERSWIKERLVTMDSTAHSYVYKMEASNVGLDGSINSLKLIDYGDGSTLVNWSFEIDPLEGTFEDNIIDYLGFLYKSCINRIQGAIEDANKKVYETC